MTAKELARRAGIFVLVAALGWCSWPLLREPFARFFCVTSDAVLSGVTFGAGGRVSIEYAPTRSGEPRDVHADDSWNARLRLRIEGVEKEHAIRINPRRLAYLPLIFFAAVLVGLPLTRRGRASCALVGAPILLLSAIAGVWVSAIWVFARVRGLVYDFSPWQLKLLAFAYEGLVTPLGNKLILPLVIGGALFLWQGARESRAQQARGA